MKKFVGALVACAVLFAPAGAAAIDNPFVPNKPKKGHAGYKWLSYGCKLNPQGQTRSYASIETWVYKLTSKYGQYRQKVKVQIDKAVGFDDNEPIWRKVEAQTTEKDYWFQKNSVLPAGSRGTLPDGVRASVLTGLQPDDRPLRAKATVWLKQDGLPNSVWRYKVYTKRFYCPDGSGMLPGPGGQLPSTGGGWG
jgi:hypothetical protein